MNHIQRLEDLSENAASLQMKRIPRQSTALLGKMFCEMMKPKIRCSGTTFSTMRGPISLATIKQHRKGEVRWKWRHDVELLRCLSAWTTGHL